MVAFTLVFECFGADSSSVGIEEGEGDILRFVEDIIGHDELREGIGGYA